MADNNGIRFPIRGKAVKLFRYKFVVSGVAQNTHKNLFGVLKLGNDTIVAAASARYEHEYQSRNGGATRRNWLMVFSLEAVAGGIKNDPYNLTVYRESSANAAQRIDHLDGIVFDTTHHAPKPAPAAAGKGPAARTKGIEVLSPDANTQWCRFSFPAYGLLNSGSTRFTSAKLYSDSLLTSEVGTAAGDNDPDGFWWATFDEVPQTNNLSLVVQANTGNPTQVDDLDFYDC